MIYVLSGGGSKGAQKKATIVVSYPSGATCTVSNSNKIYTALDTSGAAAFVVDAGAWTVKATNGTYTKTETVTVEAGKYAEVELAFDLLLFHGTDNIDVTGGFVYTGLTNVTPTISTENSQLIFTVPKTGMAVNSSWIFGPKNKIDLSKYSQLKVVIDYLSISSGSYRFISIGNSDTDFWGLTNSNNSVARVSVTGAGTYTIDVSSISGSYYIKYIDFQTADTACVVKLSDWRLTP